MIFWWVDATHQKIMIFEQAGAAQPHPLAQNEIFACVALGTAIAKQPKQGTQNGSKHKPPGMCPVGNSTRFHAYIR